MRLIDADAYLKKLRADPLYYLVERYGVDGTIEAMPTIDAVQVVRCKDCKYNYANQIPSGDGCQLCVELPISKDFFCAYGERMDEEGIK